MNGGLRDELLGQGAALVGYAALTGLLGAEIAHLDRAVSIAVARRLSEDTLGILARLQKRAVRQLKAQGYRTLAVPPDSDRKRDTFVSGLYSLFNHKMAATSAGIGWVGKSGLLISAEHGPRLSLATVLTNAPLAANRPVEASRCGACTLCRDHCPSGAITGAQWARGNPFVELVRLGECRGHKAAGRQTAGKPNCGLCITVCPYGRKQTVASGREVRSFPSRLRGPDAADLHRAHGVPPMETSPPRHPSSVSISGRAGERQEANQSPIMIHCEESVA